MISDSDNEKEGKSKDLERVRVEGLSDDERVSNQLFDLAGQIDNRPTAATMRP